MAFKYATDDRRGNPRIVKADGEWTALREYFTDTVKYLQAEARCDELNGRVFSFERPTRSRR